MVLLFFLYKNSIIYSEDYSYVKNIVCKDFIFESKWYYIERN